MSAKPTAPPAAPSPLRAIVLVWLGWAVLMLGFQAWVPARFQLARPDNVLDWTGSWTNADAGRRHPYLQSPILKGHAAWDSEFYISIALHGYDDPAMRAASPNSTPDAEIAGPKRDHPTWVSLNHAFFPGYPFAMAIIARPLAAMGLPPVGAATTAGVIVSLLAALFAMIAIADLAWRRDDADGPAATAEGDSLRAAFYLVIWPAAAFLAQVYAESLFLALSFGALAMMRRGAWRWAAALAVAAVFTRATGVLLIVPFGLTWLAQREGRTLPRAALAAAPLIAYLAWRLFFGGAFDFTETRYFGRWPFALGASWDAWSDALGALLTGAPQQRAYYLLEFGGAAAGIVASLLLLRRDLALALYGLAILVVTMTSGDALGMHRYVIGIPALFLAPAVLGRGVVFDRLWTLGCCLGLAVLTLLFSFGFWAG